MEYRTKREFFERQKSALEIERSSFVPHWKDIAEFTRPRRGRFFLEDRNKGGKRYQSIINSRATQAVKVSRAGLMAGVMSPSRQWFALESDDQELMKLKDVRMWLEAVTKQMNGVFNRSNLFNMTSVMFEDLLLFATGAMFHEDDDEDICRFYALPIGSYLIGQDERYEVNTLIREFQMTVEQLYYKFGYENLSERTKALWDKGDKQQWITVTHYIGPNPDKDSTQAASKYKDFTSCTWENGNPNKDQFLKEAGFDEFPVYIPRWDLTGEDVWGTDCPGMVSLGDIKQLQIEEKRKAQAIDKMVNPPLKGPASLRNVPVSSLPGGLTVYDSDVNMTGGLQPIYQVDPRLQELNADIQGIENRIDTNFYVDLFFAITNMEGIQPRNQLELTQRNQERLLQLGPVLERLHSEFLNKLINRTFNQLVRRDLLPPAPDALQGQPLKVQFISTLAMAQRSEAVGAINDISQYIGSLVGAGFVEAAYKFDAAQSVDEMALILGVPASVIRDDQEAEIKKQEVEQQMQAAQQAAQEANLTEQVVGGAARNIGKQ